MKIMREWLGGAEEIDLGTVEGYTYFATDVVQDYDAADELIEDIANALVDVVVNATEVEYIERYTRLDLEDYYVRDTEEDDGN